MAKRNSALGKLSDGPILPQPQAGAQTPSNAYQANHENNPNPFEKKEASRPAGKSPLNKLSEEKPSLSTPDIEGIAQDPPSPPKKSVEKKPLFKKKEKPPKQPKVQNDPKVESVVTQEPETVDYDQFNAEVEEHEILQARKEQKHNQRKALINKINATILVLGCVYLIFLIYGALNTQYTYNDEGKVVPQVMTVEEIQALHDFNVISADYRQVRMLYEEVLKLDYRIAAGLEDPLLVAPEYEKLLEQVEQILIQSQALSVTTQYTQVHSMINTWLGNDIAIYCQKMSSAISKNNAEDATLALKYKDIVYNDFSIITANIAAMGSVVSGAEVADIESWSPEKFINSQVGEGIGGS